MSNGNMTRGSHEAREEKGCTNLSQCLFVMSLSGALVTTIISGPALKEKYFGGQNTTTVLLTEEQRELADVLTYSNSKELPTFQELPVIWSRNIAELSKLITSGEDGCFVFINGDRLAQSWIVQNGVIKKGVPSFTVKW